MRPNDDLEIRDEQKLVNRYKLMRQQLAEEAGYVEFETQVESTSLHQPVLRTLSESEVWEMLDQEVCAMKAQVLREVDQCYLDFYSQMTEDDLLDSTLHGEA